MHRIDTATKAVDLFGAGKHGFKNGDKANGIAATDLDAAMFNGVQEEIVGVIEAAGIALIKGDHTQLLAAIVGLIVAGGFAKLNVVQTFVKAQRGAVVDLADGATITADFSLANNFRGQLGGNRTLAVPTNLTAGQSGIIDVIQDVAGSRTLALDWGWSPPGGNAPTLSTAALARDQLVYFVGSAGQAVVGISIAAPGVVTWAGHPFKGGEKLRLTTTGALPTGLSPSTTHYIKPVDANSFQLAATPGGAAIATSGSQSGVHTAQVASITVNLLKGVA